jgi:hypothetical protein
MQKLTDLEKIEYHILTDMDPDELANHVNTFIEMGWILQGGVSVTHCFVESFLYAQAMVKSKKE